MFTKLLLVIARYSLGGRILTAIDAAHQKTVGHRTEILVGIEILVEAAKLLGLLDSNTADSMKVLVLGAIAPTLAEKIGRVQGELEAVIPK